MSRPASRVVRYLKTPRIESGRFRKYWKSHRSSGVESGGYQILRVGTGHPDAIWPARRDPTREKAWENMYLLNQSTR